MKALIFAAGLGERMRPLTDHTPKPLLVVGGKPLIVWHLERMAGAGVEEVVINTSWLAEQFPQLLGDGAQWGVKITYSHEGTTPLETGGGMLHALPLLGEAPFLLVNGDVWTDYDFSRLPHAPTGLAHLVMVDPPSQALQGDFALDANGRLHASGSPRLTYAGIGIYRPEMLADWRTHAACNEAAGGSRAPRFPLAPILRAYMADGHIRGEHHRGHWTDVGTPQRLAELDEALRTSN